MCNISWVMNKFKSCSEHINKITMVKCKILIKIKHSLEKEKYARTRNFRKPLYDKTYNFLLMLT